MEISGDPMPQRLLASDQGGLRQRNLAALLALLRQHDSLTRSELAHMTHLNPATITRLSRELIGGGLVCEDGLQASPAGRPAIPLRLDAQAGYMIGAEIGFPTISVIVTDFSPTIVWRTQETINPQASQDEVLAQAVRIFEAARDFAYQNGQRVFGLGLGVPGLVDTETGTLLFAPNLHWADVPLKQELEAHLGIPITVDNIASVSALGESYFGAAQNHNYVLYLSTQGGLGGRFVTNGSIMRGASGFAGEVGHMTVTDTGRRCNCGRVGCWETHASQIALLQRVQELIGSGQASLLSEATGGDLSDVTVPMIVEAAQQGDAVAVSALEEIGHWLGVGLANIINATNPDLVVIGGVLTLAHEFLLPIIEEVTATETLRWVRKDCEIRLAAHGADTCLFGGVATVYRQVLNQPLEWI
jgi:glucokinase-like ROK family protein